MNFERNKIDKEIENKFETNEEENAMDKLKIDKINNLTIDNHENEKIIYKEIEINDLIFKSYF